MNWLKTVFGEEEDVLPSHWEAEDRSIYRKLARCHGKDSARKMVEENIESRKHLAMMYRKMHELNRQTVGAQKDGP